nr:cytochrome P460 family protein [Pararhizobium arenae]
MVRLAYEFKSSPRNDAVFPAPQSFVAGNPTNVQVSVKDSERFVSSGGWGYGNLRTELQIKASRSRPPVSPAIKNSIDQRISCSATIRRNASRLTPSANTSDVLSLISLP